MLINKFKTDIASNDIAWAIQGRIANSRFTAEVETMRRAVKILKVRLRKKKLYCGNHPKACEAPGGGKHKRLDYLEGADWVEFNDLINDVLDKLNVECSVATSQCILRKGRRRRVEYEANEQFPNGTWKWDMDGPDFHYVDNCGNTEVDKVLSKFPFGTPGIDERREYFCVGAHDHDH
jgi:hypothetical protein